MQCSRETPTCQQCQAASSQCIQRRFGSVIDSSDPSSISYIESLKSRIRNLESRISEAVDTPVNGSSNHNSPVHHRNNSFLGNDATLRYDSEAIDPALDDQRPRNGLQDAMHEASYLSLSAMAEPTDQQPFSTQGLSLLTLLLAATSVGGTNPSLPIGTNASLSGTMADFRNQIFPEGSSLGGVQTAAAFKTFLEKTSTSFPLMARGELEELFDIVVRAEQDDLLERMTNESPEKIVIASAGIAIGLMLSPNYSFTEVLASELAMKAVQLMPRVFNHAGDLAVVQCLTSLTIYSLYTTYGGSSWHLLGLAMTRCISSGMHTSRASDSNSDSEIKRQNSRAFWTLYILDTYLSTTLDRPFCLNDSDIMVSPPSSPRVTPMDADSAAFRHLIQHAQILRSIRKQTEEDLVCHFVNLRHWKETVPALILRSDLTQEQLYTRGLVELLKTPTFADDAGRNMVLKHAEEEFAKYADSFECRLTSQHRSPGGLEGHLVFAIGVVIASQPPNEERRKRLFQCVSSLTMLSTRYSAVQGLRNVLAALQSRPTSSEHLRVFVDNSEIAVSRKLQRLIFGGLQAADVDANWTAP
jgi:hypothetical protein